MSVPSIHFSNSVILPPNQTAPGLEPLARTKKLYLVRSRGLPGKQVTHRIIPPAHYKVKESYKIYDSFGMHIFSAAELVPTCSHSCGCGSHDCSEFTLVMIICNVTTGEPILSLCRRNATCFAGKKGQQLMQPYYELDKVMTGPVLNMAKPKNPTAKVEDEYTEEDPEAYLHLRYIVGARDKGDVASGHNSLNDEGGGGGGSVTTLGGFEVARSQRSHSGEQRVSATDSVLVKGAFLGHYWESSRVFAVHDSRFIRILAIAESSWVKDMYSNMRLWKDGRMSKVSEDPKFVEASAKDLEKRSRNSRRKSGAPVESKATVTAVHHNDDEISDDPMQVMKELLDQEVNWTKTKEGMKSRVFDASPAHCDILDGGVPVGYVERGCDLTTLSISADPKDCYVATFPREFTQVDKALILGFLLYKANLSSEKYSKWSWFTFVSCFAVILFVLVHLSDESFFIFRELILQKRERKP